MKGSPSDPLKDADLSTSSVSEKSNLLLLKSPPTSSFLYFARLLTFQMFQKIICPLHWQVIFPKLPNLAAPQNHQRSFSKTPMPRAHPRPMKSKCLGWGARYRFVLLKSLVILTSNKVWEPLVYALMFP